MKRPQLTVLATVALAVFGFLATQLAQWHPALGLDLQGGASVVLQPKTKTTNDKIAQTIAIIRSRVDASGVGEASVTQQGDAIVVSLPGVKDPNKLLALVGQTAQLQFRPVVQELPSENDTKKAQAATTTTKAGAATTTKVGATTTAAPTTAAPTTAAATTAAATTAAATTAAATTAAATTAAAGDDTQALGAGGRSVGAAVAPLTATATTTTPATTKAGATTTKAGATTTKAGATTTKAGATTTAAAVTTTTVGGPTTTAPPLPTNLDTTPVGQDDPTQYVILPLGERSPDAVRYLLGPAELTGNVVKDAYASNGSTGGYVTILDLTSKGSAAWDAMATKYFQKQVAVVLDGVIKSAPTVQALKFNGRAEISGAKNIGEAQDLATVLKYGALPVVLVPQTVETVSATLGRDSLNAGLATGGFGLLLVAAYMLFYYRRLGFVVIAGLFTSGLLMWILVSYLSVTRGLALSISGAVGIIVSVGITVDSYVVYFERLRDEMRSGRSFASAAERGFHDAWRTILAADFTSLIGAAVLYFLTVGSVRGFAFFLGLSTLLDMFVSYFFTRPLMFYVSRRGAPRPKDSSTPLRPSGGGPGPLRPSATSTTTGASS